MTQKICAIHQPNFFPWLGYFDKIKKADVFIFLNEVQFQKKGGTYTSRVQLNFQNGPQYFTCPVNRGSGTHKISQITFADERWKKKFLQTLQLNYAKYPNFKETMDLLQEILNLETQYLSELNIFSIKKICSYLKIETEFKAQSELESLGSSTELLCHLVKEVNCNAYLYGGGAQKYQENDLFINQGIELVEQNFTPTPYGDPHKFQPGLSIIDYLMSRKDV